MRSTFIASLARLWSFVAVLATGCALSPTPSGASTSRAASKQVFSVWEFDTMAALDEMLDIKGCEGWRLAEAFTRGEKIIAVLVADGVAPAQDPACRSAP